MKTLNINPPQTYQYNGYDVTFFKGDNLMVNATEMAKAFGKRPIDWLRLTSTDKFINALREVRFPHLTPEESSGLVTTVSGKYSDNREQGTWFHEDVAIEFARWLSPTFAIWCNDRIKDLMTTGSATLKGLPDFNNPVEAARAWADAYEQKQQLETQTKLQQKELQMAAPKVDYYENVLSSKSTYNANQIAKELGMSAVTLNKRLNELGVQYKQGGTWLLYHRYQGQGLTRTKTHWHENQSGEKVSKMQTVWTEKGRKFIHEIITKHVRA